MLFTAYITTALLAAGANSFCQFLPSGICNVTKQYNETKPDIGIQSRQAMSSSSEQHQKFHSLGDKIFKELDATRAALDLETSKNTALETDKANLKSDIDTLTMRKSDLSSENESLRQVNENQNILITNYQAEKRDNERKIKEFTRNNSELGTSLHLCQGQHRYAQYTIQTQNETIQTCTNDLSGCNTVKAKLGNDIGKAARFHQAADQAKQGIAETLSKYLR